MGVGAAARRRMSAGRVRVVRAPAFSDLVGVEAHFDFLLIHRHTIDAEVHVRATETPWVVQVVSERDHVGHADGHAGFLSYLCARKWVKSKIMIQYCICKHV